MNNRSAPTASIVPVLVYDDVLAASDWLCATFGLRERLRAGDSHVQLSYGDGAIFLTKSRVGQGFAAADEARLGPPRAGEVSCLLHIRVADVEAHYQHAVSAGARVLQPPATHMFGERQYTVEDLAGYRWTFSESVEDVDPRSWGAELGEGKLLGS